MTATLDTTPPSDSTSGSATPHAVPIAGEYTLTLQDSQALPCCTVTDSTGTQITLLSGTLTLGEAAPQPFVLVGSGVTTPASCVIQIPPGATYDPSTNTVTLPNGDTYTLPPCGNGHYTLTLDKLYTHPDGSRVGKTDIISGRYAWGYFDPGALQQGTDTTKLYGDTGELMLVSPTMHGGFVRSGGTTTLSLSRALTGSIVPPPKYQTYQFTEGGS